MLTTLLTFAGAATLLVLVPGPDTLIVLRSLVVDGRRKAFMTAAGVLTGLSVWVGAAALGLTALLRASHDGYLILRLVGAAYLMYIGIQALRSRALESPAGAGAGGDQPGGPKAAIVGKGFRAGLLTDLLNPKVGVFFITFLPAFIPHGAPVVGYTLLLGAVFAAEGALYFAAMFVFYERLNAWLGRESLRRRLNRATGLVLIGFGVRLAVEG